MILAGFSYDAGETWRCDRKVAEHPGEPRGHLGWPVALAMDESHLVVAIGKTQVPSSVLDGPAERPIAKEEERIEVVFFQRETNGPQIPGASRIVPIAQRDSWKQSGGRNMNLPRPFTRTANGEIFGITGRQLETQVQSSPTVVYEYGDGTADKLWRSRDDNRSWASQPIKLPEGFRGSPGAITRLTSGRILCAIPEWTETEWNSSFHERVGHHRGYTLWNPDRGFVLRTRMWVIYSDDNGTTWHGTDRPIDISPFHWCVTNDTFIETSDGTVTLLAFGNLDERDTRERLDCTGLFRSTDGGETWGDFSMIACDTEHRLTAYNETSVIPLTDDLWVAFLRTEHRSSDHGSAWMSRAISSDRGYTWSPTELCFVGGVPAATLLPDGGIALGHSGGTRLTYNLGRTWTRIIPCGGYAVPVMLDDDTIAIGNGQNWGGFNILRRIETRYFEWVKHRDQLQQDSDLVAYYDFENIVAQLDVKNIALNSTESLTGKIIAAQNFQKVDGLTKGLLTLTEIGPKPACPTTQRGILERVITPSKCGSTGNSFQHLVTRA